MNEVFGLFETYASWFGLEDPASSTIVWVSAIAIAYSICTAVLWRKTISILLAVLGLLWIPAQLHLFTLTVGSERTSAPNSLIPLFAMFMLGTALSFVLRKRRTRRQSDSG